MMLAFTVGWAQAGPLDLPSTPTATLNITVDGDPLTVIQYTVVYVANPVEVKEATSSTGYTYDYQAMNIYVPSNATEDSPIILQDNNGGWNGGKPGNSVTDGVNYNGTTDKVGQALKAGYVIANVGCRSRFPGRNQDLSGNYIAHAPAQVVDVKAAIRYLRHNDAAMPGTTDRIIITGTSGGGALAVAIAASGNSPEYYPYLYELGAAGVTCGGGTCSSTLNDDVFGTVAYCAITDLDHMDAAYEWMYNATRTELGIYSAEQMAASDWLKKNYVPYFNRLGLGDEKGKRLTAPHFLDAIKALVEKEIEEAYVEVGPTQMASDINALTYKDSSWYSIDANGKATVDMNKYLYFVVMNKALKGVPAADNVGSPLPFIPPYSESTLGGTTSQEYSNFTEWAWNNNALSGDGVGYDDTGLPWRAYIQTAAGKAVLKQMKMINPMPYLVSDTEGDSAPYWYFRHGMLDRDTSFAVEAALYYAVLNAHDVSNVNFELAWLKGHGGDYDVPEAYEWVAEAVDNAKYFDAVDALIGDTVTHGFSLPTGDATNKITYKSSNEKVFKVVNGQAVVHRPYRRDAEVTLKVEVVSDKISLTGFNYGKVDVTRAFTFTVPALSEDQCKDGGWQHLFRTNGTAFKNQGDCIQYANTGK
jgi:hypothetical protein